MFCGIQRKLSGTELSILLFKIINRYLNCEGFFQILAFIRLCFMIAFFLEVFRFYESYLTCYFRVIHSIFLLFSVYRKLVKTPSFHFLTFGTHDSKIQNKRQSHISCTTKLCKQLNIFIVLNEVEHYKLHRQSMDFTEIEILLKLNIFFLKYMTRVSCPYI